MFPDNIIDVLGRHIRFLDGVDHVVERSLATTDESMTAGIDAEGWSPIDQEMHGGANFAPTLARYTITIQHMVIHAEEEKGREIHRKASKDIRDMIYYDVPFNTELRQQSTVDSNSRERVIRFGVQSQEFASNDLGGSFVSMSVTTVSFDTETIAS